MPIYRIGANGSGTPEGFFVDAFATERGRAIRVNRFADVDRLGASTELERGER